MKTIIAHLFDNTAEESVAKMIWIAVAFVVGAVLIALLVLAFKGPITNWFTGDVDSWFGDSGLGLPGDSVIGGGSIIPTRYPLVPEPYEGGGGGFLGEIIDF